MKNFVIMLLGTTVATSAYARAAPVTVPAVQPALVAAPTTTPVAVFQGQAANSAYLRSGTPVALKMAEALSTEKKKLRVGQRFQLEVAEAVVVNGLTVIPIGSPAIGEVTDVKNKGMWGKSGKINARVLSVRVGDRVIRMSGQLDDKGTAGGIGAVAAASVFLPVGFFVTGTSARIPLGAPVKGFIDEDVQLAFAVTAPVPLVVPMAVAPVTGTPAITAAKPATVGTTPITAPVETSVVAKPRQ